LQQSMPLRLQERRIKIALIEMKIPVIILEVNQMSFSSFKIKARR
jgi:hypothetical protein